MKNKLLLTLLILSIVLISGCSSYEDCFNDCYWLHSDKDRGIMTTYNDTSCLIENYICLSIERDSEYMKYYVTKHCYNECKPQ